MSTVRTPSVEPLFEALSDARRRYVMSLLLSRPQVSVEELCDEVVAWERTGAEGAVVRESVITISLVHNHLPKLDDLGLVDYDVETGRVARADVDLETQRIVERAIELDESVPVAPASPVGSAYRPESSLALDDE
ncbi:DUF7344 domain-containing protein [Natronosalvus halobius]|uniref:DUF7344 domain-containing protein n=1 Tax=Natronosalvus halobius TaxID=2953746 RepID=UPI00209F3C9E|nr:helix-turn-helix transcriptional regulator [Natronosalvus halobius]USZ70219.1 ArsR family transcriptional regulator [Natronosalvus halobius]